jgi:DNA-binding transcriptional MerR regulator
MKIGELATATGVPTKTIRYYEEIGLLPEPARQPSGYRDYASADVARVEFVAKAKALGMSLEEVGDILRASAADVVNCDHVVGLLRSKREEIDGWIRDAMALRDALDHTIRASESQLGKSTGDYHCPVIEHGLHERALHAEGAPH